MTTKYFTGGCLVVVAVHMMQAMPFYVNMSSKRVISINRSVAYAVQRLSPDRGINNVAAMFVLGVEH
jgi:hypothetical protein